MATFDGALTLTVKKGADNAIPLMLALPEAKWSDASSVTEVEITPFGESAISCTVANGRLVHKTIDDGTGSYEALVLALGEIDLAAGNYAASMTITDPAYTDLTIDNAITLAVED